MSDNGSIEKPLVPQGVDEVGEGSPVDRRAFLTRIGIGACAAACGGAGAVALDFIHPKVLFEPSPSFVAGRRALFPEGTVFFEREKKVYIIADSRGVYAMSAVCTHLGCITRFRSESRVIACPCHGSVFNMEGDVMGGPAPRPLPWLEVRLNEREELVVDTSVIIPAGTVFKA